MLLENELKKLNQQFDEQKEHGTNVESSLRVKERNLINCSRLLNCRQNSKILREKLKSLHDNSYS